MVYITKSPEETKARGRDLARVVMPGAVILLDGEMGSGKTTFVQGFLEEMGVKGRVVSPTFIIMKQYNVDNPKVREVYHVDLYRVTGRDIDEIGISSLWGRDSNVFLLEWPSLLNVVPPNQVKVKILVNPDQTRMIDINYENTN